MDQGSGASSFTFSLDLVLDLVLDLDLDMDMDLGHPRAILVRMLRTEFIGQEVIRGSGLSPGSRQSRRSGVIRRSSEPAFLTHRGSG